MVARSLFIVAVFAAFGGLTAGLPMPAFQRGRKHPTIEVLQSVPVAGRCVDPGTGMEAPYEGDASLMKASDQLEPRWAGFLHLPSAEIGRQLDASLDAIARGQRRVAPPHRVTLLDLGGPPGAEPITIEGVGTELGQAGRDERWVSYVVRCTLQRH